MPFHSSQKCPSYSKTQVKPKNPLSAKISWASFMWIAHQKQVMLLNDCAKITPSIAIPAFSGNHLLLHRIPPLHSPRSDNIPLLLIWDKDIQMERDHSRRCPISPKQIGHTFANATITVSIQCYQLRPCQFVWWPSVIS